MPVNFTLSNYTFAHVAADNAWSHALESSMDRALGRCSITTSSGRDNAWNCSQLAEYKLQSDAACAG